ncbi:uncharacterized protein LOC119178475 isoform X5 [Rhipicephalus microplus]|uniref:uncharacterized protein LOC119178475 isoform X5 n=1 Tax=Rhipicephalus microplus TaxID=6941 RepID=UPI003F6B95C1
MHTTNAYLPWFYHYGFVSFARCRETPSASRCRGEGGGDKLFFSFLRFREPVLESFSQRLRFFRGCNLCLGRKDAGGLGTAQQRLHTSEQPPCYPDYKARRGNGPTKRTVMFCCFYGWESLKKDDDPALYDKKAENSQVENETPKTPETLCRMSLDIGEPARLVALSI